MIKFNNNIPKGLKAEISATTLEKWNRGQVSNYVSNNNTIEILDEIGDSYWSEGVTAKSILNKLNSIGNDKDVDVIINSGGGDVFEGIAIHNVLKQHKGNVTVKIIGLAGSAASIIALGGDDIKIAKNAFFMIHNAWMVGAGNKNDFRAFADFLEPFDNILAETYVDFTGLDKKEIVSMMDNETWLSGEDAVSKGFADSLLDEDIKIENSNKADIVAHKLDVIMAKSGVPRSQRRKMMKELKEHSTQNAAISKDENDMQNAINFEPLPKLKFNY